MFNLIVAVISIALIAAMAAASIFYGGDGFSKSSARAQAATLISQAQQIAGAAAIYKVENSGTPIISIEPDCSGDGIAAACAVNRLVDGRYLAAKPVVPTQIVTTLGFLPDWTRTWSVSQDGDAVSVWLNDDVQAAICEEVERQGGASRTSVLGFLTANDFGFDAGASQPYRCADLDLGGIVVTVFGYRL